MLIILIILLLVFGFGGYRLGPGLGYYGGGGISLIILIVIILLFLRSFELRPDRAGSISGVVQTGTVENGDLPQNAAWGPPRGTRSTIC